MGEDGADEIEFRGLNHDGEEMVRVDQTPRHEPAQPECPKAGKRTTPTTC